MRRPTMTKMHFQLIADVIKSSHLASDNQRVIAQDFAVALQCTNPAFDIERFMAACGAPHLPKKADLK